MKVVSTVFLILLAVTLLQSEAYSRVIRVPGANDETIQSAVNIAEGGDTLMVQRGQYSMRGFWDVNVNESVAIIAEDGPGETVIDCQGADASFIFNISASDVSIIGFSLTGTSFGTVKISADGFFISNCRIYFNNMDEVHNAHGSGIIVDGAEGCIEYCNFFNNIAYRNGAAVAVINGGNTTIWTCLFNENESNGFGGAIYANGNSTETLIKNCIFQDNLTVNGDGGAIAGSQGATLDILFCNFLDNEAGADENDDDSWGGAVYMGSQTNGDVMNNIFWGNAAPNGSQIADQNAGNPDIDYNLVMDYGDGGEQGWEGDNIFTAPPGFVDGRNPNWGVDGFFLPDTSELIDAGSDESSEFGMDTMSTQYNFTPDEDAVDIGYHYYFWHFDIFGTIEGTVFRASDNARIQSALVTAHFGAFDFSTLTFFDGFYRLQNVPALPFWIEVSADGYLDSVLFDFELGEGETQTIDWNLLHPEIGVSLNSFEYQVQRGTEREVTYHVRNTGDGTLDYVVEPRPPADAYVPPWSLRLSMSAGDSVDDDRLQGVVFADSLFFISGQNGSDRDSVHMIYALNRDGDFLYRFPQAGDPTARRVMYGLAYDGEYLRGVRDDTLWTFDFNGEIIDKAPCPVPSVQTLAWDPHRELVWMSRVTGDISGVDDNGEIQETISGFGLRKYGMGYWPDDPDGYNLYMISEEDDILSIHRIDIENEDFELVDAFGLQDLNPGGACITGQYDIQNWVLGVVMNNRGDIGGDKMEVWQVAGNTSWMIPDPAAGSVPPADSSRMSLTFDAEDLPLGIFEGEIVYLHNAIGLETHIPVAIDVTLSVENNLDQLSPASFEIVSIYPNPFNSQTTVIYHLPVAGEVNFSIFDIMGREITGLSFLDNQPAGRHSVSISGDHIPSGMYVINLEMNGKRLVDKVLLMK